MKLKINNRYKFRVQVPLFAKQTLIQDEKKQRSFMERGHEEKKVRKSKV